MDQSETNKVFEHKKTNCDLMSTNTTVTDPGRRTIATSIIGCSMLHSPDDGVGLRVSIVVCAVTLVVVDCSEMVKSKIYALIVVYTTTYQSFADLSTFLVSARRKIIDESLSSVSVVLVSIKSTWLSTNLCCRLSGLTLHAFSSLTGLSSFPIVVSFHLRLHNQHTPCHFLVFSHSFISPPQKNLTFS